MSDALVTALQDAMGDAVSIDEAVLDHYCGDWSGLAACRPLALARPGTTTEVATVLRLCHEHDCPVTPQGGLTGLAGGAVPTADAVALCLERLVGEVTVDPVAGTLTAWAGTPLERIQEAASQAGFRYPVDFAARGSCHIGGNVATNAGGHAVLRHGMTRERVLGLEVVLADGQVLDLMNTMVKNNAGYDLKHCFIGSEGTLGLITRVVLRLAPEPNDTRVLLCALPDYSCAVSLLHRLHRSGLALEAFEVMWQDFYATSCEWQTGAPPLDTHHPLYVLCEMEGDETRLTAVVEASMDMEEVVDAVLASSTSQARQLWAIREATAEFPGRLAPINFDVSLPIASIGNFVQATNDALKRRWPGCHSVNFGHIGDSNLHLTVDGNSLGANDEATHHAVEALVYESVGQWHGSISAEHGVGLLKRDFLHYSVTPQALETMRTIKQALDPRCILNPGKIFTVE